MKKIVVGMVIAVALAVGITSASVQAEAPVKVVLNVSGVVSDQGVPISNVLMTLSCAGQYVDVTRTNANGYYSFVASHFDCPIGSIIRVFAYAGGKSGSAYHAAQVDPVTLNIVLTGTSIPEYDWLAGVLASGAGIGALVIARRRCTS